jgi:2-C-methyl-D-erythritol 4-phosphate cytidylyltransferase
MKAVKAIADHQDKVSAVILTGGEGSRIKEASLPKQFIEICGKPLFLYALETYANIDEVDDICLVMNRKYVKRYKEILERCTFRKNIRQVYGGAYRQESVENALNIITHNGLVAIHNGVNPLTSASVIKDCIKSAHLLGAVTAYLPASHTIFSISDQGFDRILERNQLGYTCDPQVYRVDLIRAAISCARNAGKDIPTVELIRQMGHQVSLVQSDESNIKLTTSADIAIIEYLMTKKISNEV